MGALEEAECVYRFGRFRLEPARRSLTIDGTAVVLSSRAFDLLRVLVERRACVTCKSELRAAVWRGMAVDDNNLAVQISVLRRALGEKPGKPHFILTIPGQGYQFVAAIDGDTPLNGPREAGFLMSAPTRVPVAAAGPPRITSWSMSRRRFLGASFTAGCLALLVAGWWWLPPLWPPSRPPPRSIVVLPFRNLSGETGQDHFADAISDDLTTDLSHIPGSIVIARASADTFRGRTATADAIGRALHVRYLLEGSIRTEGDALHVNAQLIDAASGRHLWARAFYVKHENFGITRAEIVRNIARALNVTLVDDESTR